jgi:hypothetical protein
MNEILRQSTKLSVVMNYKTRKVITHFSLLLGFALACFFPRRILTSRAPLTDEVERELFEPECVCALKWSHNDGKQSEKLFWKLHFKAEAEAAKSF